MHNFTSVIDTLISPDRVVLKKLGRDYRKSKGFIMRHDGNNKYRTFWVCVSHAKCQYVVP